MTLMKLPEGYLDKELEKQLSPEEMDLLERKRLLMTNMLEEHLKIFREEGKEGLTKAVEKWMQQSPTEEKANQETTQRGSQCSSADE